MTEFNRGHEPLPVEQTDLDVLLMIGGADLLGQTDVNSRELAAQINAGNYFVIGPDTDKAPNTFLEGINETLAEADIQLGVVRVIAGQEAQKKVDFFGLDSNEHKAAGKIDNVLGIIARFDPGRASELVPCLAEELQFERKINAQLRTHMIRLRSNAEMDNLLTALRVYEKVATDDFKLLLGQLGEEIAHRRADFLYQAVAVEISTAKHLAAEYTFPHFKLVAAKFGGLLALTGCSLNLPNKGDSSHYSRLKAYQAGALVPEDTTPSPTVNMWRGNAYFDLAPKD